MCGIAGYARPGNSTEPLEPIGVLMQMTASLAHRGPDGDGFLLRHGVALGHSRLSVLDPARGLQPICQDDPPLSLVHNGEVYNFRQLNDELAAGHGVVPRSRCDAETILHAYAAWGERSIDRLEGMFAFVIHDASRRLLLGARDRLGEKPLHYVHRDGLFAFASEPRALLEHPAVEAALDLQSAASFLVHEHVPAPRSIWRGVNVLPPGHRFIYDLERGTLDVRPWWRLPLPEAGAAVHSLAEWTGRIRAALRGAVERQLVSDVPLGVFLSGGLDSTAVAAIITRDLGRRDLKTFSIGFADRRFDEGPCARQAAGALGTDHHELRLEGRDAEAAATFLTAHLDEPFADPSILPTWCLARFARRSVTVALGGDGGDELFAGYQTFAALPGARLYRRVVPRMLHDGLVEPLAARLHAGDGYFTRSFKARQFLRGARERPPRRLWRWLGAFTPAELPGLLTPEAAGQIDVAAIDGRLESLDAEAAGHDDTTRDVHLYASTYLPDGILTKLDRATMSVGLEARSPLLDPGVVALAMSIPGRMKVRLGRPLKHLLRDSVRDILPRGVAGRPKHGFAPPMCTWLRERGALRDLLMDTLSPRRLRESGYLRPQAVARLLQEHLAGRRDHRKPLFTLLMLEQWRHHWIQERRRLDLGATG